MLFIIIGLDLKLAIPHLVVGHPLHWVDQATGDEGEEVSKDPGWQATVGQRPPVAETPTGECQKRCGDQGWGFHLKDKEIWNFKVG